MERTFICFCYTLSITITFLLASAADHSALHTIITDQDALLALKAHITLDPHQIITKNWSVGSSICHWTGVSCSKCHHRVTALDISEMGLTGTIAPHIGNLSFLVSIKLNGNKFHGDLPHELGNLRRLKMLNLTFNAFTGTIRKEINNLTNLQYLGLAENFMTGTIPEEMSKLSKLQTLDFFDNNLTGEIPSSLGSLKQLKQLSLSYNHLSGTIPKEISKLYSLQVLWLDDNQLTGSQEEKASAPKHLYLVSSQKEPLLGRYILSVDRLFVQDNSEICSVID